MAVSLKVRAVPSSDRALLLLTNYRGGGIGDFGQSLERHLKARLGDIQTEETSLDGRGAFRQAVRAARHRGPLVVNLGLTAWGPSGWRNFIGFSGVALHRLLGRRTTVILHHALEILDPAETGYRITVGVRLGAYLVTRSVRNCEIVVFSPRLHELMSKRYGARRVWLVPLPGEPTRRLALPPGEGRLKVVSAGYWAPYKGIGLFVQLAARFRSRADFVLGGRPHTALSTDADFRASVEAWLHSAREAGVRMPGFQSPSELDAELSTAAVGLLPYTSVSGASASFQLFAERGVPVIASDLPEFQFLRSRGAGVVLASPTVDSLSDALSTLSSDADSWRTLAEKQSVFNQRYSWETFVDGLLIRGTPAGPDRSPGAGP
jgi:glycosyltransferase involved in cell wall biosynthesis